MYIKLTKINPAEDNDPKNIIDIVIAISVFSFSSINRILNIFINININ